MDLCKEVEGAESYVCDAIMDKADGYVSVSEGYDKMGELAEWMEEAVNQGLVDTRNFSIDRMVQAGCFEYYTQECCDNLANIAFNAMLTYLQKNTESINLTKADEEDVIDIMDELANDFDYNNTFSDLSDTLKERLENVDGVEIA